MALVQAITSQRSHQLPWLMASMELVREEDDAINFSTPIIVRVGVKRQPFVINQDVLKHTSRYFKTALQKCWKKPSDEGEFRSIVLAEAETPKNFNSHILLLKCYMLGDMLLDTDSQMRSPTPSLTKKFLYEKFPESAKIRELCIHLFVCFKNPKMLHDEDPPQFLRAVATAAMLGQDFTHTAEVMYADRKYHEHGPGPHACYRDRLFTGAAKPEEPARSAW
ncbi:hypothetical protein B0A48_18312 [Cryoendolithus antarcticus]|uniref:BTB domain-containing protein n=1 Tax=Cryoendolithus antarcticus TaxID=1507870 RepID=A0A1V8S9C8_9PEZI|nr:hypothetical protein B0A48_18312 [Cryoendolithus antarcticus]